MSYNSETTPLLGGQHASIQPRDPECQRKVGQIKTVARKWIEGYCSREQWKTRFPITKWIVKYSFTDLQCDIIAGLTVGMTVIPQGLAYATLAGLPPQYGLYSAFMGCFVYFFLGTSKDVTLGPTAIMSLMTATFATSPIKDDPTLAIVLCLGSGVIMLVMGLLSLGIIVNFISHPVINAFTSAAAITIAFGQLKSILGLNNIPQDFPDMVYETFKHIPQTNYWDLIMGVCCYIILFIMRKIREIKWKDTPGVTPSWLTRAFRYSVWLIATSANAIVVIIATGVSAILINYDIHDLSITGNIKSGLPSFRVPDFSIQKGNQTITTGDIFASIGAGFAIVPLLGIVELIAIAKAFSRRNNYKVYPSQELVAVGIANIISCFFQSYPVTGSFSRTAVNSQSGVRTPASGLITGGLVLIALAVLTPLFKYIPKSALAAVIIFSVIQMVDYEIISALWKVKKIDLIPLVLTFVACLGIGLEYGIIIGVGVSLLMLLYPMARPTVKTLQTDVLVLSITQGLTFPACDFILEEMERQTERDGKYQSCVLDCSHISALDFSSIHCIQEMILEFEKRDAKIVFASISEQLYPLIQHADIKDMLCSPTIKEAIVFLQDELKKELQSGITHSLGEVTISVDVSHQTGASNTEDIGNHL